MPYNKILTDKDRKYHNPTIMRMYRCIPEMTNNKIASALVQQAFVYDAIFSFALPGEKELILSAGSYQDTAAELLRFDGFSVYDIDPVINCTLHEFRKRTKQTYDRIISTSVLEHTTDDAEFIADICELLSAGGIAILTCDFKDDWIPGQPVPYTSNRFYTTYDLMERIPAIFRKYNCDFFDIPDYSARDNFVWDGITYSFATMVFQKGS